MTHLKSRIANKTTAFAFHLKTLMTHNASALFYTPSQQLGGFVLTGAKVAEKTALTKELPPVLT